MEKEIMRTTNLTPMKSGRPMIIWMVALAVSALLTLGYARLSFGQKSEPKTFSSPAEASNALFQAVKNADEQALEAILGAGKEVTSSSDEVEDKLERERFSQKYQEMHRLVREPDGTTVLYVGAENWPFPIPLVSRDGRWHFDAEAGRREVMFRRIGANEAIAIEVSRAAVQAAKEPDTPARSNDPILSYAERLAGTARATGGTTGRATPTDERFHGYCFVVL